MLIDIPEKLEFNGRYKELNTSEFPSSVEEMNSFSFRGIKQIHYGHHVISEESPYKDRILLGIFQSNSFTFEFPLSLHDYVLYQEMYDSTAEFQIALDSKYNLRMILASNENPLYNKLLENEYKRYTHSQLEIGRFYRIYDEGSQPKYIINLGKIKLPKFNLNKYNQLESIEYIKSNYIETIEASNNETLEQALKRTLKERASFFVDNSYCSRKFHINYLNDLFSIFRKTKNINKPLKIEDAIQNDVNYYFDFLIDSIVEYKNSILEEALFLCNYNSDDNAKEVLEFLQSVLMKSDLSKYPNMNKLLPIIDYILKALSEVSSYSLDTFFTDSDYDSVIIILGFSKIDLFVQHFKSEDSNNILDLNSQFAILIKNYTIRGD